MKSFSIFGFLLFVAWSVNAQQPIQPTLPSDKAASISFKESKFDFGDIFQGEKVQHTFSFENSGTAPLVLSNVIVQCGCTASQWPKEPIAPGESAEIEITFDTTGKFGMQNKSITVVSNATNPQETIRITANVLPSKKKK